MVPTHWVFPTVGLLMGGVLLFRNRPVRNANLMGVAGVVVLVATALYGMDHYEPIGPALGEGLTFFAGVLLVVPVAYKFARRFL